MNENNKAPQDQFGGQNQIVNQQEQNRPVNPSGLSATDTEESLYGPPPEAPQEKAPADEKKNPPSVKAESDEDLTGSNVIPPELDESETENLPKGTPAD